MIKLPTMLFVAIASVPVHASVSVVTTGTPGSTPISLTIGQDVAMTVTNASTAGDFILFALKNVHATPSTQTFITNFTSNLSFSVNGLGDYQMNGWADEGYSSGGMVANDAYFWWSSSVSLQVGDVVTLRAGSISASAENSQNFSLHSDGTYEMFLYNASSGLGGVLMSTAAAPVPEPSTYGLMLGGLALAGAALRRRRFAK